MGGRSDAEPLPEDVRPANDGARHAGLVRGADDRRRRRPSAIIRFKSHARFSEESRFCLGGVQGPEADAAGLESPASPAYSSDRQQDDSFSIPAGRVPASGVGAGHARRGPARKQMSLEPMRVVPAPRVQRSPSPSLRGETWRACLLGTGLLGLIYAPASAFTAYV